jgi:hypothetical protein
MTTAPTEIEDRLFWQQQCELFSQSGLSRASYCRQQAIDYHRFGYWLKQLQAPALVPVKLVPIKPSENTVLCSLLFSNGYRLNIYDITVLPSVLEMVRT